MGKYVTQVGTSISRAVPNEIIPNTAKTAVLVAIIKNENIAERITTNMLNSIAIKSHAMYEYGRTEYTHGLPSGEIYSNTQGEIELSAVLQTIEGASVYQVYRRLGPPNLLHMAWVKLTTQHGYNRTTNQLDNLTLSKGTPVYLNDIIISVPKSTIAIISPGVLNQWGTPPMSGYSPSRYDVGFVVGSLRGFSSIQTHTDSSEDKAIISFSWEEQLSAAAAIIYGKAIKVHTDSITINLQSPKDEAEYFHVEYIVNNKIKYFMYQLDSGVHPTLDALSDAPSALSSEFYPFAYFRYNKASSTLNKTTAAYTTSKQLVKYLGIDYDSHSDYINLASHLKGTEQIAAQNDIKDVEQAILISAIPANTSNALEQKYLFEYFRQLYLAQINPITSATLGSIDKLLNSTTGSNTGGITIVIQDKQFKFTLNASGLFKQLVIGTIGAIGAYSSEVVNVPIGTESITGESSEVTITYTDAFHYYYRKQVSSIMYEEIQVSALSLKYHIYGGYHTVGDGITPLLLIPLDETVTRNMGSIDLENLFSRSLHYVFNSRVVTKLKWYQTGVFQVVMIIIAVIIGYFYPPAGGWTLELVLATVVQGVIIGQVLAAILPAIVKAFGLENSLIGAILIVIVVAYDLMTGGTMGAAQWAPQLLMLSNGLFSAIGTVVQSLLEDISVEMSTFDKESKKQLETLESDMETLLGSPILIPKLFNDLSVGKYIDRSLGRLDVYGLNYSKNFVSNLLRLPTVNDTFGEHYAI